MLPTTQQASAEQELALIIDDIAGTPGAEHRGVEFWVAVAQKLCKKHGCKNLSGVVVPIGESDNVLSVSPSAPRKRAVRRRLG